METNVYVYQKMKKEIVRNSGKRWLDNCVVCWELTYSCERIVNRTRHDRQGIVAKKEGRKPKSSPLELFHRAEHLSGIKGGDPSAGSPTDTLLQLSPPHKVQNRNGNKLPLLI